MTGMPSRLSSTKNFWMALVSSAICAGVLAAAGVARPADLAQAVAVAEVRAGLRQIEIAPLVEQLGRLLLPDAHHLRRLLFERHPREQIGHALTQPGAPHRDTEHYRSNEPSIGPPWVNRCETTEYNENDFAAVSINAKKNVANSLRGGNP